MGNSYNKLGKKVNENDRSPGFFDKMFQGFTTLNKKAFSAVLSYISPFMIDKPIFTDWDTETAVKDGLMASHVVYACVRYRAWNAASVPWIVEEKNKQGQWVRVKDHPLENLIEHPNSVNERVDLIARISMFLDVCGNALIYKTIYKGAVMELIPVQPDRIKPIPDTKKFLAGYQFNPVGKGNSAAVDKSNVVKVENIIHWMYPNPINPYWGLGPLQTVGRVVDTEVEALKFQKSSLQNKLVKDGILSFKKHLTPKQWENIQTQFSSQVGGSANARGPIVLGEEATYQPFSMTPHEMDFTNSRRMAREDICMAFAVPPPLIGILDNATYANVSEARVIFWLDTMIPHLELIAAGFNRSLVPHFGDPEKLRVNYDLTQVPAMWEAFDKSVTTARKLFEIGYPTNDINIRLQMGMPNIEGGDRSYIPGNLMVPADIKPYGADVVKEPTKPATTSAPPAPAKPTKPPKDSKKSEDTDAVLPGFCFPDEGSV